MRIGALMGATDDNIRTAASDVGEILIEIEIVAGEEAVAKPLDLDYGRGFEFVGILGIHTALENLSVGGVLFIIVTYLVSVTIEGIGGIPESNATIIQSVNKQNTVTALGSLSGFFKNSFIVSSVAFVELIYRFRKRRNVGSFGKHDEIHRLVAFVHCFHFPKEKLLRGVPISGIVRLDYTDLHNF